MNAGTTYIPIVPICGIMRALSAGQIIKFKHLGFHEGQFVEGLFGLTSFAVSDGKGLKILDLTKGTILHYLRILVMPDYRGYVSPNNICGKLKFFVTRGIKPDLSEHQRIGEMGITLHSLYTSKLQMVQDLIKKQEIVPTKILKNEFNGQCFTFKGMDGVSWQIIQKMETQHKPITKL